MTDFIVVLAILVLAACYVGILISLEQDYKEQTERFDSKKFH